jgi:DNA polymerase
MSAREREIWLVDQHMNARGLPVDGKLLEAMAEITLQELLRLSAEINVLTGGYVTASSQNARLLDWCQKRGYPHPTLERETLTAFIGTHEFFQLDFNVQGVLMLRAEASKTSTAKLLALQNYASTDGYARNLIQYGAAVRTLRWGGRGPQIQNFPRPVIDASNIAPAIELILDGPVEGTADTLRHLYGNPLDVISSCLRGVFKTPKGWSFVVCDYSAIEAVVLAWLSEFGPLLEVFRKKEQDIYVFTAQMVGSNNRQLGKVLRLACGYGMGHVKFQETANKAPYFLDLSLADAHSAVTAFRTSNAPIVALWHGIEATARNAILRPSETLRFKKLGFRMASPTGRLAGSLLMELPSGRNLVYRNVRLENGRIVFWGVDQMTRRWKQLDTYGGKLVENATQAVARDLLADTIVVLERHHPGAALTTVHDEIIAMTEDACAPMLLALMRNVMTVPPYWGRGLPLSANGSISKRYGK